MIKIFWDGTIGYVNWLWDNITLSSGSLFGNYFYFLGIISVVFFFLEVVHPWRKKQKVFRRDFWLDAFYMYFNFFVFYIVLFAGLEKVGDALMNRFWGLFGIENTVALEVGSWPVWSQFLLLFVVADFTQWNVHRMLHKVPFLWQFHKLHHSVKEMGFAAHLRYHWMESIIYKSISYFPLMLIGFGVDDFFYLHIFNITWGHFNHANFAVPLGPLKYIFNSPQMHMYHHAKKLPNSHPYGMNFGLTLSVWDYLFKTSYTPDSGRDIELGFDGDENYPKDFVGQIADGFKGFR